MQKREAICAGVIFLLCSTVLVPVVDGEVQEQGDAVDVKCRMQLADTVQETTTTISIEEAMRIQRERNDEKMFALLKKYDIIPAGSSIASLGNEFQKTINENPALIQRLKTTLSERDGKLFGNLLCFMRLDWTCETTFFVPLFMGGTSPIVGWINFPIWMIFGWLLQPFFERTSLLASLFFISLLNPSTDVIDIGIGGRFNYDVETMGLLGKKCLTITTDPCCFPCSDSMGTISFLNFYLNTG